MQAIGKGERSLADVLKQLSETKATEDAKPTVLLLVEWFTEFLRIGRYGGNWTIGIHRPAPEPHYFGQKPDAWYRQEQPTVEFDVEASSEVYGAYWKTAWALATSDGMYIDTLDGVAFDQFGRCRSSLKFLPVGNTNAMLIALLTPLYRVDWDTAEKLRILVAMDYNKLNYVERIMQQLCQELLYYYEGVLNGTRSGFKDAGSGTGGRGQERLQAPLPRIASDWL